MLVYSPLSHVSYFTTRQSPPDLPELPPSTTTTALMFHLIFSFHFSPSPGTSFHFINPSYLKLNESPARFLLFFFIQPAPFTIFPLQLTIPDSPHLHQILPALLCGCSPTQRVVREDLIPQRRLCQLTVLGAGSRSPRPWVQSRGSVPLQDYADLNSIPLSPEVGRPWNKQSVQNKSLCRHDGYREGWERKKQRAVWRCCQWKGKMETWWWGGKEKRQAEKGEAVSVTHKPTFLVFLEYQVTLNQLLHEHIWL